MVLKGERLGSGWQVFLRVSGAPERSHELHMKFIFDLQVGLDLAYALYEKVRIHVD